MNRNKVGFFFSDEGPTLETLDYTIRIGSTPTFLYFDLYLYSAYAAHYVYDFDIGFYAHKRGAITIFESGDHVLVEFSKRQNCNRPFS